jgi:integrase/recombinase XerD
MDHVGNVESLGAVVRLYAEHLRAAGCRPRTVTARLGGVSLLGQAAGKDPRWAGRSDIARWLATPGLAAWSRTTYYGHARAWFQFLLDSERRSDNPTERLKRPRPPRGIPRPLTAAQVADALAAAGTRGRSYVLLGAFAGLRVHEIAQVRGQDVSATGIRVVGKGGHERIVPTHPLIWADAQSRPRLGWWFPSHAAEGHVVPGSVSTGIRRTLLLAGVHGHAHQLRHFFGTEVLRAAGGDIRVAQELLGHASPATTALYTLVDSASARAAVLALPGA